MFIKKSLLLVIVFNFVQVNCICILPVTGQPFAAGTAPMGVAFSPLVNGKIFSSVTNFADTSISTYQVDTSTGVNSGVFTSVSAPVATGIGPFAVAYSPLINNNLFVGVANEIGSVTIYISDLTTGALSVVGTFAAGAATKGIAFSPVINGNNLLVAASNQGDNTVSVYSVQSTTGVLTQVPGSPFVAGAEPLGIAFSPIVNGNLFAAITNVNGNTISVFSVNMGTGAFSLISTVPLPGVLGPRSIAFSPLVSCNLFAFVPDQTDNVVITFQVNTNTGAFTQVSTAPSGLTPTAVAFSPLVNGILLSGVANQGETSASIYNVNTNTGSLSQLTSAGSPFATGNVPDGLAFSPLVNQRVFFAIANGGSANISVYKVIYAPLLLSAALNCATKTVTITGSSADAGATISVIADGVTVIGTGIADALGNFSFSLPLATSNHTITVTQTIGACTTEQSNSIAIICSPVGPVSDLVRAIIQKYCPFLSV